MEEEIIKLDSMKHLTIYPYDPELYGNVCENFLQTYEVALVEHYKTNSSNYKRHKLLKEPVSIERVYHIAWIEGNEKGGYDLIYTDKGVLSNDKSSVEHPKRISLEDITYYETLKTFNENQ